MVPVEMLGQTEFPRIGDQPYFLSLGAYAFNWFKLQQSPAPITERTAPEASNPADIPALLVGAVWDTLLDGTVRSLIERDLLSPFIQRQPWFQGGRPRSARFRDWAVLRRGAEPLFLTIVEVADEVGDDGQPVTRLYLLPLALSSGESAKTIQERAPGAVLARLAGARKGVLFDGWYDDRFAEMLLELMTANEIAVTRRGHVRATQMEAFPHLRRASDTVQITRAIGQSAASIGYGKQLTLKVFRRLEPGLHPEVEVTRFLNDSGFSGILPLAGLVDYEPAAEARASLAMVQQAMESQWDGWSHAIDWLARFFEVVAARQAPDTHAIRAIDDLTSAVPTPETTELLSDYLKTAAALGRRTAEMHLLLASDTANPSFAPEPLTTEHLDVASRRAIAQADRVLQTLESAVASPPARMTPVVVEQARGLLEARTALGTDLQSIASLAPASSRIRIHGDYRLAQILLAEGALYIQNIEGHPSWPAAAQREKQSPLRDIAGMMRSFSYAAHAALLTRNAAGPTELTALEPWARFWQTWTSAVFLQQYFSVLDADHPPPDRVQRESLLRFFVLDRALRELDGELNNRPEWVGIPLRGILDVLDLA
jgi:maltose alpha-D-glucosyltransferase/alpha-amylase